MKILIYGFGMTPLFVKPLVEMLGKDSDYEFSVILPSSHHQKLMQELLGESSVLCINTQLPKYKYVKVDLSILRNYPDNIYQNIESQKAALKSRPAKDQVKVAYWTYHLMKEFVEKKHPNHILYIQSPEDMQGMILGGIAKELGISIAVPHHTRHIGLSFFSSHRQEILPRTKTISSVHLDKAYEFLEEFRAGKTSAGPAEETSASLKFISYERKGKLFRFRSAIYRFFSETESREVKFLKVSLLNNLPFLRDSLARFNRSVNSRIFNCSAISDLPEKYIFYPIQYSPESSINIPSPYFVDQLRVIDAIRMAMPSGYTLVVKEHPVCIGMRPRYFMKSLLKKAGVVAVRYDLNTKELIKRSSAVISVTGTAALEAFLIGKPSLVMGPTFFAECLGGVCGLDDLPTRIKSLLSENISNRDQINFLAKVFAVSSDFIGRAPGEGSDRMMTYENLKAFWTAFEHHIKTTSLS